MKKMHRYEEPLLIPFKRRNLHKIVGIPQENWKLFHCEVIHRKNYK